MTERGRFLILGLDGVPFSLIDPWIETGKLPTLASLVREGVRGDLRAYWPINSISSWASFLTGNNPARHGMISFLKFLPGEYKRRFVTSGDLKAPLLFDYAPELKVAIVNVPSLYPPIPVNGLMISGMLAPQNAPDLTYPKDLRNELERQAAYLVDCDFQKVDKGDGSFKALSDEISVVTRRRFQAIEYLMEHKPWDVFVAVETGPDRLLHFLGGSVWEAQNGNLQDVVLNYFIELDAMIARLLERLSPKDSVIILSDHGFGPLRGRIYIAKWLVDWGYLVLRPGWLEKAQVPIVDCRLSIADCRLEKSAITLKGVINLQSAIFNHALGVIRSLDVFGIRRVIPDSIKARLRGSAEPNSRPGAVLWGKTRVFPGSYCEQGLYINLQGRQPCGTLKPGDEYDSLMNQLQERLESLKHPVTGKPFRVRVLHKQDQLSGPYYDLAPDMFIEIDGGNYDLEMPDVNIDDHLLKIFSKPDYVDERLIRSGTHRENGIFIARGPAFRPSQRVEEMSIVDVMPTVMHVLEEALPEFLDGDVRPDLLEDVWSERDATRVPVLSVRHGPGEGLDGEEEEEIARRLRGIGYISEAD